MLAQNFKTPADLGISDVEFDALAKVLGMLERGEIDSNHFNMARFRTECGTIGCICGWAYFISRGQAFPEVGLSVWERLAPLANRLPDNLSMLFGIGGDKALYAAGPQQAAIAVRNFLTCGEPRWNEAMASL